MANVDTTRHPDRQTKHYVGARMQQGRSVLDSDWNEDATLRAEELRKTFVELIGARGSSNAGFGLGTIEPFVQLFTADGAEATTYDFELRSGSFWLGGMHLTIDEPESFLSQVDWLQINASKANLPSQPTAHELLGPPNMGDYYFYQPGLEAKQRRDLVYVEAWEQPVTVVEDAELRERALGGPDTSVRIRRMRRIHVLPELDSDTPSAAAAQMASGLTTGYSGTQQVSLGTYDANTCELHSAARLTVTAISESSNYPCGPKPPQGYTGHEDRTIRVELRGPTSLIWGFGNTAPLYRAKLGAGKVITLLNRPRDPSRHPQPGQIAELIPWGSKLPNDEKAAELTGHLVRITGTYNPSTGALELAENPPEAMVDWLSAEWVEGGRQHEREQDPEPSYIYVRIWDRGPDIASDTVIEARERVVPLGHTGLQVVLDGAGRSGDYWIIAARRATPALPVPWNLKKAAAPHGPRRFYSPLAIVTWEAPLQLLTQEQRNALTPGTFFVIPYGVESSVAAVYGPVKATITDLRRTLTRLCMRGCATIIVGDGDASHGMVDSLEDALALLPTTGGRIQLLPGDHVVPTVEPLVLDSLKNVTICGCGPKSKLVAATVVEPDSSIYMQGPPLLTLKDCDKIVLENFTIVGERAPGIKLENGTDTNRNVLISRVIFSMDGVFDTLGPAFALSQPAIYALGSDRLTVEGCHVQYTSTLNYTPALVLGGTDMVVRDNVIEAIGDGGAMAQSMGGLQILSFSRNVEISGNLIRGGWGYGIALGHMLNVSDPHIVLPITLDAETSWAKVWGGRSLGDAISHTHDYSPHMTADPTSGDLDDWTPGGPVIDISIHDNRICDKGLSGISTGGFALWEGEQGFRFIVAINVDIHRNEIVDNLRISSLPSLPFRDGYLCVGGICLAASINAQIRENVIANNGVDFETPTVGVGFIVARGAVVRDNIIVDNGLAVDTPDDRLWQVGLRGGIVALEVTATRDTNIPDTITDVTMSMPSYNRRRNEIALTVHKNVVRQRTGKALWVLYGFGPIVVSENSLHGFGDPMVDLTITASRLAFSDMENTPYFFLPARGACVEIRNYAYSPAVDFGAADKQAVRFSDSEQPTIEGGGIDFCQNEVSLDWHWFGGYAASVVLSSLDSVKVTDNVMRAVMGNVFPPSGLGAPLEVEFLTELMSGSLNDYSFLLVNCWAGAPSTVQASGNRFEEPIVDCLFSYLGAHAAAFGDVSPNTSLTQLTNGRVMTMNVASHCLVSHSYYALPVPADNVAIYQPLSECQVEADVEADEFQIVHIRSAPDL